jgi:hypothetical protein
MIRCSFCHPIEQQRNILNINNVAVAVILFPSICFTTKQLHKSNVIHNNSAGGILKDIIRKLISEDILVSCPRGIKNAARSTCLFIKRLPLQDDLDMQQEFESLLGGYTVDAKPITLEMYRTSCQVIHIDAIGTVQEDVYEIFRRPEYVDIDLSPLGMLPKSSVIKKHDFHLPEYNHGTYN